MILRSHYLTWRCASMLTSHCLHALTWNFVFVTLNCWGCHGVTLHCGRMTLDCHPEGHVLSDWICSLDWVRGFFLPVTLDSLSATLEFLHLTLSHLCVALGFLCLTLDYLYVTVGSPCLTLTTLACCSLTFHRSDSVAPLGGRRTTWTVRRAGEYAAPSL